MFDLKLPDYEVLVHIRYNAFGKKLEEQLLSETALYALEESSEYEGHKDFHWSFKTWREAVSAGNILKKYCGNPNLLLLKVKANYDSKLKPIVLKDMARGI